jgi:hypothetical protein
MRIRNAVAAGMAVALRVLAAAALLLSFVECAYADNYSDIWWNPLESGWGVTIADHETNVFGVLYVYRSDGRPVWFTIPGGTFSQGRRIFQGDVYVTSGPSYTHATFDASLVTASKVGTRPSISLRRASRRASSSSLTRSTE